MADKTTLTKDKKDSRDERVKAALRANLQRRKQKARALKKEQDAGKKC